MTRQALFSLRNLLLSSARIDFVSTVFLRGDEAFAAFGGEPLHGAGVLVLERLLDTDYRYWTDRTVNGRVIDAVTHQVFPIFPYSSDSRAGGGPDSTHSTPSFHNAAP